VSDIPLVPTWDDYFLGIAAAVSARAKCTRRKVGAVVVTPDRRVIATGYNGAAPGDPDCLLDGACPRGRVGFDVVAALSGYDDPGSPGFCIAVHAEANALLHATRDTDQSTVYITDPPCPGCRKVMAAAGVLRAVWPAGELDRQKLTDWSIAVP
jgi:dCMP deaminase